MNAKRIISLSLVMALSATISAYAESTIYTDGIGRIHFLGRDAGNNVQSGANYANSANQDLTRKLYEKSDSEVVEDTSFSQHPLKNYTNTFPSSRFSEVKFWKPVDEETAKAEKASAAAKTTASAVKGQTDYSGIGPTNLDNPYVEKKETVDSVKKINWWWKKNK